ncbi:hypothetical protein PV379_03840 [Streptomyces caniscabiei]|uniref:hypothetical protein n=1 Tax=Streptomyces caniscabiei TaxID=2746961 RepID=UPI0029A460A1|nr:hypothetical protein [Streptomyces caniscabiei]MDX2776472.1 hypothetical protein [Streptomyces caniscabiei]
MNCEEFLELIWQKGAELYRDMPWRQDTRPYYVLVSELMLQQTQVDRVIPKFTAFIERFPDEVTLASAPLSDVLTMWNGLGYNRRARFLHESAKRIVHDFNGIFPQTAVEIRTLPGVGEGTTGAIMTYAFNAVQPFIETNVRTVYFQHFFQDHDRVTDAQIMEVLLATMATDMPREFYWALMDYGSWLKRQGAGRNALSSGYKKQSPLKGSVREVRGQIIKALTVRAMSRKELEQYVQADERFEGALRGLARDALISVTDGTFHLTK